MKTINKFIYWTPRIFSILFILFLTIFSFDIFVNGLSFWQVIFAFLMHNIPTSILVISTTISWKYEIVGAMVYFLFGFVYMISMTISNIQWYLGLSWSLILAIPAFIIGILYLLNWTKKKKQYK